MNDIGDLSWYLGCVIEGDKMESVMKMTQTAFVASLIDRFDIQDETQTLAPVNFYFGRKRIHEKEGGWP